MLSDTENNILTLSGGNTSALSGLTTRVGQKDYIVAIENVSRLPAENVIYWTNSQTFGKFESFTHPNM